jgi:ubiquinone biosynthesis protein
LGLFQTARRFNMVVQPQLILLQKTLLNIEGLGRQLYPDLDLWKTGKPFLENWMRERMGVKAMLKNIKQQAPDWIEKLPQLPQLVFDTLQQGRQSHELELQRIQLEQSLKQKQAQRTRRMMLGASSLGLLAVSTDPAINQWAQQMPWFGWAAAAVAWLLIWRA